MSRINSLSIIIPMYNNSKYLPNALRSVDEQVLTQEIPISIYVIDDCSTIYDKEWVEKVIDSYRHKGLSIQLVRNSKNLGTVKTLNKILKLQQSDLIIPLAVDDTFYNPRVLELIIQYFNNNPAYKIATAKRLAMQDTVPKQVYPPKELHKLFTDRHKLLHHIAFYGNIISGACTYYTKEFFMEYGYFDEHYKLLEDYPTYLKTLIAGESIGFLDTITIKYNLGGVSTAPKKHPALIEDFNKVTNSIIQTCPTLSKFDKRYICYFRIFTRRQRYLFILFNLDVLALKVLYAIKKRIKKT